MHRREPQAEDRPAVLAGADREAVNPIDKRRGRAARVPARARAGLSRGAFLAGLLAERPGAGGWLGEPPGLPGRAQSHRAPSSRP